jgi:3-phosphoshikimate 1-carboxyvinyltransferase
VAVSRAPLRPFDFDATGCPDLFPPLVALAAAAEGVSTLRGAGRLRNKESDRAASLAEGFSGLGVPVEVEGDLMRVRGGAIRGGAIDARNDHRIAMAAAVAALASSAGVEIEGHECVRKSWPEFFEDLGSIARCSP